MQELLQIMQRLRQECEWDKKQTPESLTQYAIEEAYEVEQAVRQGNIQEIKEELGDLLLQVVFQSQMYSEQNQFNFQDVVSVLKDKLIRRHPHVFNAQDYAQLDEQQIKQLWQEIKQQEKLAKLQHLSEQERAYQTSYLSQVKTGSALMQAESIQKVSAKIGFDFENFADTYAKLDEELAELKQAIHQQDHKAIEQEFGDCLFALINVGRKLGVSSETALLGTTHKFRQRFAYIEQQAQHLGKSIETMTLAEMDLLWEQAKQALVKTE